MSVETIFRLHAENYNGDLLDLKEEYSPEECASTVPAPGDLIVSPWVAGERDNRRRPEHRTVYEVKARYFLPRAHGDDRV